MHRFKRTIIKGNASCQVPVTCIFTSQMIKYIDCLIKHRDEFVDNDNQNMFARVATSQTQLRGSDTMKTLNLLNDVVPNICAFLCVSVKSIELDSRMGIHGIVIGRMKVFIDQRRRHL